MSAPLESRGNALINGRKFAIVKFVLKEAAEYSCEDAATEIIEYVKAHQIDLILAGSSGQSQIKRLLLGSQSSKFVHYAGCSV
jgi:nucleotide-binding universal stress UspA family protein